MYYAQRFLKAIIPLSVQDSVRMNNWQQCSNTVGEEALKSFDITRMNKKPSNVQQTRQPISRNIQSQSQASNRRYQNVGRNTRSSSLNSSMSNSINRNSLSSRSPTSSLVTSSSLGNNYNNNNNNNNNNNE